VPKPVRTAPCTGPEARSRLRIAQAYLEVARQVLDEPSRDEFINVAAGLAVLGGIAASDAICGARLGRMNRGESHSAALDLLRQATPDGGNLATKLGRLLSLKDAAHYGVPVLSVQKARSAIAWAGGLVDRALEETQR
jgi:hypothetical protein